MRSSSESSHRQLESYGACQVLVSYKTRVGTTGDFCGISPIPLVLYRKLLVDMARIWVRDDEQAWLPAKVISDTDDAVVAKKESGEEVTVPKKGKGAEEVVEVDEGGLSEPIENLVLLESFTEGMILHHTRKRFENNLIYTSVGSILVAVNPFQGLPIYGEEIIMDYRKKTMSKLNCSPHIYQTAGVALTDMEDSQKPQSVLISGESGAGKTETTKKVLQFIAMVAKPPGGDPDEASIEDKILRSNPVLESFGNAKTLRNDNSSRFGKYMVVDFDKSNKIQGSQIISYLLEKVRVVAQGPGERNYHAFYMLLEAASPEQKEALLLGDFDAPKFSYLNQSQCYKVDRRDELEEMKEMMDAFNILGFSEEDQDSIMKLLTAILFLGNVEFEAKDADGEEFKIKNADPAMTSPSTLLGVDKDALEHAFTFREMKQPGGGVIDIPRKLDQCDAQRDATTKTIYGQLFLYLVAGVNKTLFNGNGNCTIGLLDIFGFEIFKINSFEQLCINFANEKLQFFFNSVIFTEEMNAYKAEGIPLENIQFKDNQGCLDLVEAKKLSILATLDEEGNVPGGCDEKWIGKLHKAFNEDNKTKSEYYGRNRKRPQDFVVHHFADSVHYCSDGFMEKNKDELDPVIEGLIKGAPEPLLVRIFEKMETDLPGLKKGQKATLGFKFKSDLNGLMDTLGKTAPQFVRCVKPNQEKVPKKFTSGIALDQLKNAGLFEAIRIRKAGYLVRIDFADFANRYKFCCAKQPEKIKSDPKSACVAIIEQVRAERSSFDKDEVAMGKTKVFLRTLKGKRVLEELRNRGLSKTVLKLQSWGRMQNVRMRVFAAKWAEQKRIEEEKKREELEQRRREQSDGAAARIQAFSRFIRDRKMYKKLMGAELERREKERKIREAQAKVEAEKKRIFVAASRITGMYRQRQARKMVSDLRIIVLLSRARSRCNSSLVSKQGAKKDDDAALRKAIKEAQESGKTTPTILSILASCQELTKIYDQVFALEEVLLDLSRTSDVEALREHLQEAKKMEVSGSAAVEMAQRRFDLLARSQEVAELLVDLCDTNDVGLTVARSNSVDGLLAEHAEKCLEIDSRIIKTARDRLERYAPLIRLRDELRAAVELCSSSSIYECLEKRNMYAAVMGPSYCSEETAAARNVIRMLSLESDMMKGRTKSQEGIDIQDPDEPPDTRLPRHIFDELLHLHNTAGLGDPTVMKKLETIPGIQAYRRCFKWIINYATWRHEDSIHACQSPNVGVGTTIRRGGNTPGSPEKRQKTVGVRDASPLNTTPIKSWNSAAPRLDIFEGLSPTKRASPVKRCARTTRTGTRGPRARQPGAKVCGTGEHPLLAKAKAEASKSRAPTREMKSKKNEIPPSEAKIQEALRANAEMESKYEFRYNGSKSARVVDDEKMRVTRTVWAPAQVVVSTSPKKESASSGVRGRRQHERTEQPLRRRGGAIEGRKGWV